MWSVCGVWSKDWGKIKLVKYTHDYRSSQHGFFHDQTPTPSQSPSCLLTWAHPLLPFTCIYALFLTPSQETCSSLPCTFECAVPSVWKVLPTLVYLAFCCTCPKTWFIKHICYGPFHKLPKQGELQFNFFLFCDSTTLCLCVYHRILSPIHLHLHVFLSF